ncbi:BQ2448_4957 [Microbotryum intermedium]|uniref:BQ2448_4957 protein n=1 Tax=Microbotryum intermedium TaxID=269621 RepID=A0A238FJS7_9BASI|nr:BQ2448_4957 [Microbotryum intermedium]
MRPAATNSFSTLRRLQFPLRVALAMTINKAQGQSFDCVGVDRSLHPVSWATMLLPSQDPDNDDDDQKPHAHAAAANTITPNPVFRSVLRAMLGEQCFLLCFRLYFTSFTA